MELQTIQKKIYEIRGKQVMLDFDLAALYGVETKVLKQGVKRNIRRFPIDFMFELTQEEFNSLRSQFVTSNKRGGTRYMPFAFTEQGVAIFFYFKQRNGHRSQYFNHKSLRIHSPIPICHQQPYQRNRRIETTDEGLGRRNRRYHCCNQ